MKRQKAKIPAALRWYVWERDNFTCHYCGARRFLSVDHKVPESKGGDLSPDNLVTACRSCNSSKSTRAYELFHMPAFIDFSLWCLQVMKGEDDEG